VQLILRGTGNSPYDPKANGNNFLFSYWRGKTKLVPVVRYDDENGVGCLEVRELAANLNYPGGVSMKLELCYFPVHKKYWSRLL
jgi:hypothetical protein